jgi:outer membrane protein assembly factor BamB
MDLYRESNKGKRRYSGSRRKVRTVGMLFVLLLTVAFCLYHYTNFFSRFGIGIHSFSEVSSWTKYRLDMSHPGDIASKDHRYPQGNIRWTFSTKGPIHSSVALAKGVIYFGSRDGMLYALDAANGIKRWVFKAESWVDASPVVHNDVVYFGSNDGRLYALDALTGKNRWQFETGYNVVSSPTIAGDRVFFCFI